VKRHEARSAIEAIEREAAEERRAAADAQEVVRVEARRARRITQVQAELARRQLERVRGMRRNDDAIRARASELEVRLARADGGDARS
jgi:hypothetical protein